MEQIFSYIISFGASVMMPILFTIIGLSIGMGFGKALKSGPAYYEFQYSFEFNLRFLSSSTQCLRHGMACSCSRSL